MDISGKQSEFIESNIGQSLAILVAEDDGGVNRLIQKSLQREGFSTQGVHSGSDVIARVSENSDIILLLDYMLSDMNGMQVITALAEKGVKVPFIVITGQGDEKTAVEMMKMGARDYIVKSAGLTDILPHIIKRVVNEITREKELVDAQEALKESEDKFKNIFENAMDGLLIADLKEKKFQGCNKMISEMLGYSHEELHTMGVKDIYPGKSLPYVMEQFEKLAKGETRIAQDIPVKRKDGTIFFADIAASPVTIKGETYQIGAFRDITKRKMAEDALRFSEEKFSKAFRSSPTLIMISTLKDGRLIDVNDTFLDACEYSRSDVIGHTETELEIWSESGVRNKIVSHLEEHGFINSLETGLRTGTGDILTVLASAEMIDIENEACILLVILDITERKKLETQLLHAQKMDAIGQLAGGVAHDFNNIITAIISYSYLMKNRMDENDPSRDNVDKIISLSDRAAQITHGLLAFSRKQYFEFVPVRINGIIRDIENILSKFITEDIELRTELASEEPTIVADKTQVEQVIINLITNARDAMPEGGALSIKTELTEIDDEFIGLHGFGRRGKYVLLSISDTGTGMDEEIKDKIYEPFFTTKEVGKGTGLGLSIIYGIVKEHKGYIDVLSESGEGTTFMIYLPEIEKVVNSRQVTSRQSLTGRAETVLIAEDDAPVRDSIREILQNYGYNVIVAENGMDAVNKFREHKDKIDLTLIDVIMPVMNGKEVYEEIRQMQSDIKVIFISGYTADILSRKQIPDGDIVFVSKPIMPDHLLSKIREVLDAGQLG
jgi:PAS domain S-box-containing protein